jgi:hypothetical protein
MNTFRCPNDKKHPLRFEVNGRGTKAYCNHCKAYFVSYPKGSPWKTFGTDVSDVVV